jgi:hypothetical protein
MCPATASSASTARRRPAYSPASQNGQLWARRPHSSTRPGTSGRASRAPVASSTPVGGDGRAIGDLQAQQTLPGRLGDGRDVAFEVGDPRLGGDLGTGNAQQLGGAGPLTRQQVVAVQRLGIAGGACPEDEHLALRASEGQCGGEAGEAGADDGDLGVRGSSVMERTVAALDATSGCIVAIMATLEEKLRTVIGRRRVAIGLSLAELGARSGVSVSTLSRIETGGRRVTVELLERWPGRSTRR